MACPACDGDEYGEAMTMQRKFEEALDCAARWHAHQSRKGTRVPYVAHLLGVASLVLEDGGTTT
jgi:(p)ppGpp synthase/HD superfamily hydrolase